MSAPKKIILESFALGRTPFKTFDPFLFCMYHHDTYPAGEENMGPNPKFLTSRDIGMDFSYQDGWSMYHGRTVPGFPEHPHRGFETITVVTEGHVDHSDSINCTARYGNGDTQWMTAGKGIQHAEMLPLLKKDEPNVLDLFQIWLNLPKKKKMCDPFFGMLWDEKTPRTTLENIKAGTAKTTAETAASVRITAGALNGVDPLAPPPNSWASEPDSDVAVWFLNIPSGTQVELPAATGGATTTRALYFVDGASLGINDGEAVVGKRTGCRVDAAVPLRLEAAGGAAANVLILQGRPIGEPVVQHGPFVMNTQEEIKQCFSDFQRTRFGGWPWKEPDTCHSRDTPRHALHPNGVKEFPPSK